MPMEHNETQETKRMPMKHNTMTSSNDLHHNTTRANDESRGRENGKTQ